MCDTTVKEDFKRFPKPGSPGTSLVAPPAVFFTEGKGATSLFVGVPHYSAESVMVAGGATALSPCRRGLAQ